MSLILEALKKSEAKRRLGETPDLGTPFSAPRRRSYVLPVVVVLIAAVLVWWGFFSAPRAPAPSQSDTAGMQRPPLPGRGGSGNPGQASGAPLRSVTGNNDMQGGAPPSNLPKPADKNAPTFVAVGPPPGMRPPEASSELATPGVGVHRAGAERRERAVAEGQPLPPPPPPVAERPKMPQPKPATQPVANARTGTARARGAGAPATQSASPAVASQNQVQPTTVATPNQNPIASTAAPKPVAASNPTAQSTAPSTAEVARSVDAVPPPAAAPVRAPKTPDTIGLPATAPAAASKPTPAATGVSAQPYSELAFSVRKSLPELRLSMHVYTADPAQRFVILNDSRLGEGEKTTDDVIVHEIRPDGVVLGFQNQRFFYPRDGL